MKVSYFIQGEQVPRWVEIPNTIRALSFQEHRDGAIVDDYVKCLGLTNSYELLVSRREVMNYGSGVKDILKRWNISYSRLGTIIKKELRRQSSKEKIYLSTIALQNKWENPKAEKQSSSD